MATYKNVLAKAAGEIGNGGGKYWQYFGYSYTDANAPAWCCMFQDWLFATSDMYIGAEMNCLTIQTGMKNAGWGQVAKASVQAGDVVIFEWDCAGNTYDHIGICEKIIDSSTIQCIEGNVSKHVGRRVREMKYVRQVWRPKYSADTSKYTGWYWHNEKCYHYTNGVLDKNGWFKGTGAWSGKWFFVGQDGAFVTDKWEQYDGQYYYCGADGKPVTGWLKLDGAYYHFDDEGVCEHHCFAEYKEQLKYIGDDGKLMINGRFEMATDEEGTVYLP